MKKAFFLSVCTLITVLCFAQKHPAKKNKTGYTYSAESYSKSIPMIVFSPEIGDDTADSTTDDSAAFQITIDDLNLSGITLHNDTLFVPAESCKYIKIGDKVYKVKVALEEVQEPKGIFLAPQLFKAYPSDNLLLRINPNISDSAHIINIPYHSIQ